MKKQIAGMLVGIVFLQGCNPSEEVAVTEEKAVPKTVAWLSLPAQSEATQRLLTGTVSAAERTRLSFQAQGQIKTVDVNVGEAFTKGQSLATLDTVNYQLQLQQAKASLNSAIARRNQARTEVKRREKLVKSNAVSKSQLEAFRLQQTSAQQNINAATAQVELAEKQLADTTLVAPFDGTVTAQLGEVGQLVNPSAPVFSVEAAQVPEISFSIPENISPHLSVGQSATVSFSALPNTTVKATISEISAQAHVGAFPATLALENPPKTIKAGMSAEILLATVSASKQTVLMIPPSALGAENDNRHFVYRISEATGDTPRLLEKVSVDVIDFSQDSVNIAAVSLRSGDKIVRSGVNFLAPQQPVSLMGQGVKTINP